VMKGFVLQYPYEVSVGLILGKVTKGEEDYIECDVTASDTHVLTLVVYVTCFTRYEHEYAQALFPNLITAR
jgi:hypothetical protein